MKLLSSQAVTPAIGGGIRKYLHWKGVLLDLVIALVLVGVGALGYDMWQNRASRPVGQVGDRTLTRAEYLTIREIMLSLEALQAEGEVQRYAEILGSTAPQDPAQASKDAAAAKSFVELSQNRRSKRAIR